MAEFIMSFPDRQRSDFYDPAFVNGELTGRLVRCKDCKYFEPDPYDASGSGSCNGRCDDLPGVDADFFCADGEVKDDG